MLAYGVRGDMNLSILMTTCSSISGLALMPLMIWFYGSWTESRFETDTELVIPLKNIIINLALTLFPCCIGVLLANKVPKYVRIVQKIAAAIMMLGTIAFLAVTLKIFGIDLIMRFEWNVVLACALLPLVGYIAGYFTALFVGEPRALCRTIAIETGCQNVQLCAVILKTGFAWCQVGIYLMIPLIYIMFQLIWAVIAIGMVRFKQVKMLQAKKRGQFPDMTVSEIKARYARPGEELVDQGCQTDVSVNPNSAPLYRKKISGNVEKRQLLAEIEDV